jgi:hypothetical protein
VIAWSGGALAGTWVGLLFYAQLTTARHTCDDDHEAGRLGIGLIQQAAGEQTIASCQIPAH